MTIDAARKRIDELYRVTLADARVARQIATTVRETNYPADYIARRELEAERLHQAVSHLLFALGALTL